MIKNLFVTLLFVNLVAGCASSEKGADGKSDRPSNIDSDITFDGVTNPDEDPFFSEPLDDASADVVYDQGGDPEPMTEPTPEPSVVPEPMFEDTAEADSEVEKTPASATMADAMRAPAKNCSLRESPSVGSKKLGVASQGRKIWTENHDSGWFKVYRKKGSAFVSKTCF